MTERWVEFTRAEGSKRMSINMAQVWGVVRQVFNPEQPHPLKGKEFTFLYVTGGFEMAKEKPKHFLPPAPKPNRRGLKVVPNE